ncbi:MAG: exo-alpha-sialidase [Pirellulales bacterium]|nr:exo-alpha-sialidase [Pirellulales bacterium]
MTHTWAIRLSVAVMLAIMAASMGIVDAGAKAEEDVFRLTIAPATAQNPRNSESDIIELRDGRLLLGWTEFYAANGADDGAARIVGRVSADGGRTWGDKYTLVENDGRCNVMEVNFLRLKNGDIALLHLKKNVEVGGTQTPDCRVMLRTSRDEGRTFGPAKELTGEKRYVETASGRALRLKTGRILVECDNMESAFCLISDDDGATWREGKPVKPSGGGCWEPAAVERTDGRVLMFLRTGLGGQYQTVSEDGGETWGEATLAPLRGTAAPIAIERIPGTGDLLAIWNNDFGSPRARNPLTAAVSRDDGKTWEHFRNVADAAGDAFAYPSVTFAGDRALLTYFNYQGGISLFLQGIPVKWFYESSHR